MALSCNDYCSAWGAVKLVDAVLSGESMPTLETGSVMQANCVAEIVPPHSGQGMEPPAAVTAEIRWSGDKQAAAHTVQRIWDHVQAHADAGSSGGPRSSVDDVHFQEALLASSPLFVSVSAPEVLADIARVRLLQA